MTSIADQTICYRADKVETTIREGYALARAAVWLYEKFPVPPPP
jgi:hypothetical protein